MALTRIGSVGLSTGIDINAGVGTFTGNLTVGGVLTYEDVTNVDSIGIITARAGVKVGSGITLSSDGDIFFTGIMTGNGSGLSNVGVDTAVVFTDKLSIGDGTQTGGDQINIGIGSDLMLYHSGSHSFIDRKAGGTGDIYLRLGTDNALIAKTDGAVELYHDNSKKLETASGGVTVTGSVNATSFTGDGTNLTNVGVDTAVVFTDKISLPDGSGGSINVGLGSDLQIYHNGNHSYIDELGTGNLYIRNGTKNSILCQTDGQVNLYYNDGVRAETIDGGLRVSGLLFGSDTAAANTLDDYEEGTFTPIVLNGWGYLNSNPTISQGKYVRIGAIVYIYFTFQEGSGTGASSNGNGLSLYQLPFDADGSYGSGGGNNYSEPLTAFAVSATSGAENIFGLPSSNGLTVFMFRKRISTGRGEFSGTNLGTGIGFCSGVYRISGT